VTSKQFSEKGSKRQVLTRLSLSCRGAGNISNGSGGLNALLISAQPIAYSAKKRRTATACDTVTWAVAASYFCMYGVLQKTVKLCLNGAERTESLVVSMSAFRVESTLDATITCSYARASYLLRYRHSCRLGTGAKWRYVLPPHPQILSFVSCNPRLLTTI
jgi:hypothetical protein